MTRAVAAPAALRCVGWFAVWCAVWCAGLCAAGVAGAQPSPSVQLFGPASNPIAEGVGTFSIRTTNFAAADLPLRLHLQVSTNPEFSAPLFADTIVNGSNADITVRRLLPGTGELYWRAFALTARAGSVPSPTVGPRVAPTHLRLLSPNNPSGQSLTTRRPTFTWRSSSLAPSAGSWLYELVVESTATGQPVLIASTTDSSLTVAQDLESNSSYRWRVKATYTGTGQTVEVASFASFVILSSDAPLATLLYRSFPNPFPTPDGPRACIWFDLRVGGALSLDILDQRGLPVRRLAPRAGVPNALPPGRYGRPAPGQMGGCDDRFAWDGTDANGRTVNEGLYVIRLVVEGAVFTERTYFRGR